MKVVAIIQARMGSTRLPGKVLMDLDGHPVLEWCVRAARAAPGVDEVIVATTTLPADDKIVEFCQGRGFSWYRGSETDVLSRFIGAADDADIVLRLTGDCPFLDPQVIGGVVRLMLNSKALYCSNVNPRTYADGLDVQAARIDVLQAAGREAQRPLDRDGVMTWIERNRSRFPAETLINPIPGLQKERWVLDTEADYQFCRKVASYWEWKNGPPSQLDMLGILDVNVSYREINAAGIMNERYFDALAEEPIYERTYTRSQDQIARARKVIPLGAQTFSKSYLQYPQPSPLFLSHGQGGLCWDVDGNEYVDLVSALLPNILGYRDPDVDSAVRKQLASGISFSLATELEAELAETLCRLIPCAEAVRFGKTGTDVTSAAVRLARAYTGRDRILICGGYHGWQDWSVERNLGVPWETRSLTMRAQFGFEGHLSILDRNEYAAAIVEPESNPEYLALLRERCDRTGALLIFDEVITGFRFNLGGAQKLWGVTPDLATFGKAMANGMPLSAIVGKKYIMRHFEPPDNIFYSGTMFGEALSLAAGIATIKKLERDQIIDRLWSSGSDLAYKAQCLIFHYGCADYIQISGSAPFVRLKFKDEKIAALFRREMVNSGTLITASHNISAAHGPSEIKRILSSYRHSLKVLRTALDKGDIEHRLAGASVGPMVRAQ